jgi:hypothetical protein
MKITRCSSSNQQLQTTTGALLTVSTQHFGCKGDAEKSIVGEKEYDEQDYADDL